MVRGKNGKTSIPKKKSKKKIQLRISQSSHKGKKLKRGSTQINTRKIQPAKKKPVKKAIKAIAIGRIRTFDSKPVGVCKMVYMGNTYCEDGITKRQCDLKVQNYPGAIVTWTKGGSCG
jgi:hypothetical protein